MKLKRWLAVGLVAASGTGLSVAAEDSAANIEALKNQIQELDQKLRILERKQELEQEAAAEKSRSAAVVTAGPTGFSIRSADTNFVLRLRGGAQADARYYDGGGAANDTFLIRRVRPVFEGTVFKNFDYRVMLDFSTGTSSTTANDGFLLDAYADAHAFPWLNLRVGKFKEPVGLERLQSWNNLLFLERGYPTQLVPNRDVGAMVHGDLWESGLQYQLGVFNGTADGGSGDFDAADGDKDVAARVFAHPFKNLDADWIQGLGVGISGTFGEHGEAPRGYVSPGSQRFFSYRTGTGAAPNVVADGQVWRVSPQAYYYWGPFGVFAEYVISSQELRQGGGGLGAGSRAEIQNTGWEVSASYFLTGEANSFKAVTPRRPVTLGSGGGWGAWELTARVEGLDVDNAAFPIFADPASSATEAFSWGVGANWHLNRNVKLQFNYERTDFKGASSNPATSQDENVFLSRVQITF
jgi:phosphate-selective porin OprO and OprP